MNNLHNEHRKLAATVQNTPIQQQVTHIAAWVIGIGTELESEEFDQSYLHCLPSIYTQGPVWK